MKVVTARQHLGLLHGLAADGAAVVELLELLLARVAEALPQVRVGAQEVAVRRAAAVQRLDGNLRVGEEENVDHREGEAVNVPHVKVMRELAALEPELRDQRGVVQRVRAAGEPLGALQVELDQGVDEVGREHAAREEEEGEGGGGGVPEQEEAQRDEEQRGAQDARHQRKHPSEGPARGELGQVHHVLESIAHEAAVEAQHADEDGEAAPKTELGDVGLDDGADHDQLPHQVRSEPLPEALPFDGAQTAKDGPLQPAQPEQQSAEAQIGDARLAEVCADEGDDPTHERRCAHVIREDARTAKQHSRRPVENCERHSFAKHFQRAVQPGEPARDLFRGSLGHAKYVWNAVTLRAHLRPLPTRPVHKRALPFALRWRRQSAVTASASKVGRGKGRTRRRLFFVPIHTRPRLGGASS